MPYSDRIFLWQFVLVPLQHCGQYRLVHFQSNSAHAVSLHYHDHIETCGRADSESAATSYVPFRKFFLNYDVLSVVHVTPMVSFQQNELIDLHAVSRTCIILINVASHIVYFHNPSDINGTSIL